MYGGRYSSLIRLTLHRRIVWILWMISPIWKSVILRYQGGREAPAFVLLQCLPHERHGIMPLVESFRVRYPAPRHGTDVRLYEPGSSRAAWAGRLERTNKSTLQIAFYEQWVDSRVSQYHIRSASSACPGGQLDLGLQ